MQLFEPAQADERSERVLAIRDGDADDKAKSPHQMHVFPRDIAGEPLRSAGSHDGRQRQPQRLLLVSIQHFGRQPVLQLNGPAANIALCEQPIRVDKPRELGSVFKGRDPTVTVADLPKPCPCPCPCRARFCVCEQREVQVVDRVA